MVQYFPFFFREGENRNQTNKPPPFHKNIAGLQTSKSSAVKSNRKYCKDNAFNFS